MPRLSLGSKSEYAVAEENIMTADQTRYEIFISYARRDNRPIPETYPHG